MSMKQTLLGIALCILIIACSKNDIDQPASIPTKAALMAHIWIEDSAGTGQPGTDTIYTDLNYESQYTTEWNYKSYAGGSPWESLRYEFEEPNKIYYWTAQDVKNTNVYLLIEKLDAKTLVTAQPYGNAKYYAYYHAK